MKTSVFSRVRSTSENLNVFITRDKNVLWYSLKKSKFSFSFFVYMPMRVFDIINNVTKQNMNVMASTLSDLPVKRWRDKKKKKKKKKSANRNYFDTKMFLTF